MHLNWEKHKKIFQPQRKFFPQLLILKYLYHNPGQNPNKIGIWLGPALAI